MLLSLLFYCCGCPSQLVMPINSSFGSWSSSSFSPNSNKVCLFEYLRLLKPKTLNFRSMVSSAVCVNEEDRPFIFVSGKRSILGTVCRLNISACQIPCFTTSSWVLRPFIGQFCNCFFSCFYRLKSSFHVCVNIVLMF